MTLNLINYILKENNFSVHFEWLNIVNQFVTICNIYSKAVTL